MKYEKIQSLEEFLNNVEAALLNEDARMPVKYPLSNMCVDQIDADNQSLLKSVSNSANVYAIFTAPKGTNAFTLRYIGKTKRKLARQRIRNHLITKTNSTGGKLNEVISHVNGGGLVKLSWIIVEPESLRNYIEEELINRHKEADWNLKN